jgi:hypothetical protein
MGLIFNIEIDLLANQQARLREAQRNKSVT